MVTILPLGSSKRGREGRKNLPTSRDCGVGMLDTTEIGASSSNKVDEYFSSYQTLVSQAKKDSVVDVAFRGGNVPLPLH